MFLDEELLDHASTLGLATDNSKWMHINSPLAHMIGGIHVDESGLRLCSFFATRAQLREAWAVPFLFAGRVKSTSSVHLVQNRHRTLDSLLSVATEVTSLYLVTSQARLPSYSLTLETGLLARRRAYSAGGSMPEALLNGKLGGSIVILAVVILKLLADSW